jgi:hypothetical protein
MTQMRNHLNLGTNKHGAVLVITLLVIVVLAVAAVAFMQNTSIERLTARSQASHYRAQLAAEAGAAAALSTVADLITRYPDSVTAWQNIGGGAVNGTSNEATVLYFRATGANSNVGASPAAFGSQVGLWAVPLVSRTNLPTTLNVSPVALSSIGNSVPLVSGVTTNLNATNAERPEPFVGRRTTTNAGAPVTAGQWVYLTKLGGPTNATNPYVARFAYWIEDESFKVNINVATNGLRGTGSLGLGPEEIRIDGAWRASTNAALTNANAAAAVNDRSRFGASGYPTVRSAVFPALSNTANLTNTSEFRFLTTTHSAGLDLSRGGFKRVSINAVANGANVRTNLDRLIAAITNANAAPDFGQRFYRLTNTMAGINDASLVTSDHVATYLNKLSANIVDYIDTDCVPTIVRNLPGFPLRTGSPNLTDTNDPIFNEGIDGANPYIALGVELRPYLYGYATSVMLTNMNPAGYQSISAGGTGAPTPNEADFGFILDHYFEFWNPGWQDIVVGSGASNATNVFIDGMFLQIAYAPGWLAGSTSLFSPDGTRDVSAPLPSGSRFPGGQRTLVTTAPLMDAQAFAPEAQNIISVHTPALDAMRNHAGKTTEVLSTNSAFWPNINRFYVVSLNFRGGGQLDYETEMLLGAPSGIIEMFHALTLGSQRVWAKDALPVVFTNRSSMFGNQGVSGTAPRAVEGDPRALNEQLIFKLYESGGADVPNQTRLQTDASYSLGTPDANRVKPNNWMDFTTFNSGAANAPLVVANANMVSIGELGNLTDPARVPATTGVLANVTYSRSGGRTLRIGQPEWPSWYDGNQTNASRTWTSWRLADIFTTTNAVTIEGLINPNGVLRDRGVALRAALHGFTYWPSPNGAPNTAGTTLSSNNVTTLITNVVSRLTNTNSFNPAGSLNPFWERGEVSQLGVLNTGTALLGTNLATTMDRGREELIRRSMQMLTTRGSVFTVYVVGQAIQTTGTTTKVTSASRLRQVFALEPLGLDTNDDFNPTSATDISARFGRPSGYKVRILSTFYD